MESNTTFLKIPSILKRLSGIEDHEERNKEIINEYKKGTFDCYKTIRSLNKDLRKFECIHEDEVFVINDSCKITKSPLKKYLNNRYEKINTHLEETFSLLNQLQLKLGNKRELLVPEINFKSNLEIPLLTEINKALEIMNERSE